MRVLEKLKMFSGGQSGKLEKQYNAWYDQMVAERESHAALKGLPFKVTERALEIRNYEGDETFCLAIWYEDFDLELQERGSKDRGGSVNGASMIGQK